MSLIIELLFEIINTRLDLTWSKGGEDHFYTDFELDGVNFHISAEINHIESLKFLEVYFFIKSDNGPNFKLTNLGKNQFKILGIVGNAIKEKFKDFPIIIFSSKEETDTVEDFERRTQFYQKLCSKIAREQSYYKKSGSYNKDKVFILYKDEKLESEIFSILNIERHT